MQKPPLTLTQVHNDEQETESRPLSMELIRRLAQFTKPYTFRRNLLIFIVVCRSIQLPLLAWTIGAVIAGPVTQLDTRGLILGTAGYALLAILTQFTLHYRSLLALQLGEDVINDLRNSMFEHLQELEMQFFHKTKLGRVISRFTSDADAVRVGVQDVLFVSLVQTGQMLVAALLMLYYDRILFLVILGMSPILWTLNHFFRKKLSQAYRAVQESFSRVTATLAESVSGIRVIQGFARQDLNAGLFHDLVADHSRYNQDAARSAGIFIPLLEFNTQLFIALVILVGGIRTFQGHMQVGDLYQFVMMAGIFFAPVQSLATLYNQAMAAMAGAERVFHFLDREPEWTDQPDATPLPQIRGSIEFRKVNFAYEPGKTVLHDLSLTIEPGMTVALVGPTGSGKSSIINLVARFYLPTGGHVFIDGFDTRQVTGQSLHNQMGIVLQQNFLFTGSVLDNIRFGRPTATDNEVRDAARRLDCLDLLEDLPNGLLTQVGERGGAISLGQRQLICFTRAMLADPRILILDEATSSVDTLTEARIQLALNALLRNRTSIVVAHRLSTIRHADVVLVLDQGRIVEHGKHEQLLLHAGLYADLYRQFVAS